MIFRVFVFFNFIFFTSFVTSGKAISVDKKKELKISFKEDAPGRLYLYSFYGINMEKIDSSFSDNSRVFRFFLNESIEKGYFRVLLNDTNYVDIILSGNESVELIVKENNLKKATEIGRSVENKALWELKAYRSGYHIHKKNILLRLQESKSVQEKILVQHTLDSLEYQFNLKASALLNQHKGTYFYLTNKIILSPLYTDSVLLFNGYKNDTASFLKENFFNNIDFAKGELVNSTLLPNQYMKYYEKHVEYTETGFKYAIDLILFKAKSNPLVYQLSLDFLLQLFNEAGPEIIFEYLVDHYYDENTCSSDYTEKVNKLRRLSIGSILPDHKLTDFKSFNNLKEIYSTNKLTLLYFWSTHCTFCTQSTTSLIELYRVYHSAGLEVFGVSIDENKEEWEKYIFDNQIPWYNYNEFNGWESGIIRSMMVNKTPTYFLVNANGVIAGKNHNFVDVEETIKNSLNNR